MPNSIVTKTMFLDILDEVYVRESLTSVLDSAPLTSSQNDAREFKINTITVSGLSNYDRANGYAKGSVVSNWETKTPDYDRGQKLEVDVMDTQEGFGTFTKIAGVQEREIAIPEIDATRFAKYATLAGTSTSATLSADNIVAAIDAAEAKLGDYEVPDTNRYLFMSYACYGYLKQAAATRFAMVEGASSIDRKIEMYDGMQVIPVPAGRFYSVCNLLEGGYENSGYKINFMIIHKPAVIQYFKHRISEIIPASANPDADKDILKYRVYGINDVYENKLNGIYMHYQTTDAFNITPTIVLADNVTANEDLEETDTTTETKENQALISDVILNNNQIYVFGAEDSMNSFASYVEAQGSGKWFALLIDTGETDITTVSYNGSALTSADVAEAAAYGGSAGQFILWLKADVVKETPKEFTLTKTGKEAKTITVKFFSTN